MFKRREDIKEPFIILPYHNKYKLTYVISNNDINDYYYLCRLLEKNNCTYEVCWQSKFDRDHIEFEYPKIYDAFNCIIIAIGSLFNLNCAISCYHIRNDRVAYLQRCFDISREKGNNKWEKWEQEKSDINYAKLAASIIASLSPQQW